MSKEILWNTKLRSRDYVWLIYYVIIYSFNVAFNGVQTLSTILLFLLVVFQMFSKRGLKIKCFHKRDPIVWYSFFWLFVSLSYLWSTSQGRNHLNMATALMQIVIFMSCVDWSIVTKRDIIALEKCFCLATFVFACVTAVTSPLSTYGTMDFGKFTGMQRNTTGYLLLFGCLFNLRAASIAKKKYYNLMALMCFVSSLLTGSRKIIIGYLIAIVFWVVYQPDIKKSIRYLLIGVLALLIIIPILYQLPFFQEVFGERLLAIFDDSIQDGSVASRNRAKELALLLFQRKPVLGNGWNSVVTSYGSFFGKMGGIYAHNNYLEVAADFGIIGLILYYWKFIGNTIFTLKHAKEDTDCRFLALCFITVLILDWAQVTYLYLYMMTFFVILFKTCNQIRFGSSTDGGELENGRKQ